MTRDHCVAILRNLKVIQAVAEGRDVYFAAFDSDGRFIEWRATNKIILGSLEAGFYSVKPRYQCMRPAKAPVAIPYPDQRAYVKGMLT